MPLLQVIVVLCLLTGLCGADQKANDCEKYPVDISFIVVDFKYSSKRGVQICEIQRGIDSRFKGYDFLYDGKFLLARRFVEELSLYQKNIWYTAFQSISSDLYSVLLEEGHKPLKEASSLYHDNEFIAHALQPVDNVRNVSSYHGILIGRIADLGLSDDEFRNEFFGIVPLDAPFGLLGKNKAEANNLLCSDDELFRFKPRCGIYPKLSSPATVAKIQEEIDSELLVIKPIETHDGHGVIIVQKNDLGKVLKYIFSKSKTLERDLDSSYKWWYVDNRTHFLVEEFIPSDTLYAPCLNHLPFDPTMRAALLLVYTEGRVNYHFIGCYWKLPKLSLVEEGSLNDKHKSYGHSPYFEKVDLHTQVMIEEQLEIAMRRLYRIITSNKAPRNEALFGF